MCARDRQTERHSHRSSRRSGGVDAEREELRRQSLSTPAAGAASWRDGRACSDKEQIIDVEMGDRVKSKARRLRQGIDY